MGKQSKLFKDRGWGNVFKFHRKDMLCIKLGMQNSFCLLNPFPFERLFLVCRPIANYNTNAHRIAYLYILNTYITFLVNF